MNDVDGPDDENLVWHYTDGAGLVSILSGHCLWATSSAFLNDAQEVALGVSRVAQRLRELAVDDETYRVITTELSPRGDTMTPATRCYILSASGSGDSLAMWRLYGRTKESYAVGLDPRARLSVLGRGLQLDDAALAASGIYLKRMRWEPVRYRPSEQEALVEAVVDDLPAQVTSMRSVVFAADLHRPGLLPDETWEVVRDVLDDLEQALVLIKHEGFVDEREVRQAVVMHARTAHPGALDLEARLLSYRATDYGIAPYLRLTGGSDDLAVVDAVSPLPIRAVAISPSPNGPAAEHSVQRLLHANGYGDVPVRRSTIPYRS